MLKNWRIIANSSKEMVKILRPFSKDTKQEGAVWNKILLMRELKLPMAVNFNSNVRLVLYIHRDQITQASSTG